MRPARRNFCGYLQMLIQKYTQVTFPSLSPSSLIQEGNVEYKYHLLAPCEARLQHLITQLKWRLQEGQGEALYEIGVSDDGTCRGLSEADLAASLETLNKMAAALSATATVIRRLQGKEGYIAEVLVRQACSDGDFIDVRIAVVGNVDR
jgi:GTPase